MEKKKLYGEEVLKKIEENINEGLAFLEISKKLKVSLYIIDIVFADMLAKRKPKDRFISKHVGYKDQEYYSEEELLSGINYNSYTWENLTEEEKQFYLNYGTENNNGADSSLESGI